MQPIHFIIGINSALSVNHIQCNEYQVIVKLFSFTRRFLDVCLTD